MTIYPTNDLHEPCTSSDVIVWADLAKELEEPVYGVLGLSILLYVLAANLHWSPLIALYAISSFGLLGRGVLKRVVMWEAVLSPCRG